MKDPTAWPSDPDNPLRIPITNTRSPQMWKILEPANLFEDKVVVDLGCGYGDLLWRTAHFGKAREVYGIENNAAVWRDLSWTQHDFWQSLPISLLKEDLNTYDLAALPTQPEVAVCCSVLPYLDDPGGRVQTWRRQVATLVLEVQYLGDGPGTLPGREAAAAFLAQHGWHGRVLGRTEVRYRGTFRDIWHCTHLEKKT